MRTIPSYLVALLAISMIFREIGSAHFFRYVLRRGDALRIA